MPWNELSSVGVHCCPDDCLRFAELLDFLDRCQDPLAPIAFETLFLSRFLLCYLSLHLHDGFIRVKSDQWITNQPVSHETAFVSGVIELGLIDGEKFVSVLFFLSWIKKFLTAVFVINLHVHSVCSKYC